MRSLQNLWNAISGEKLTDALDVEDATSLNLKKLLEQCPLCGNEFSGHRYTSFASIIIKEGNEDEVIRFFTVLKEHSWLEARKFKSWDATRDDIESYLIQCTDGRLALLIIRAPAELYEPDTVIASEHLSVEESAQLFTLMKELGWRYFSTEPLSAQ